MKNCPTCGKQFEDTNTLCPEDGTVLKRTGDDKLIGEVLAGKYRVDEKLAEGGMGCVYRATHVLMEKAVAVKVLHPALAADDKIVARFTREAKAASRISHPHAIVVTDFGEAENGVVYLVMEYLRGRTLKEIVRAEGPLSLERTVDIVRQVGGALQAAHDQGVVHRDLKSDNIMLVETGDADWAKVLDFGIAKVTDTLGKPDPGLTAPNLIIGTPQYMSPEQCSQASEIDARSDIYSLGVILYEMLAGHVPFTGDSPTAIMMAHMQEPPPSVLEERRDLPASVGRVVARALAKQPDERYQSASELADAFAEAASEAAPAATSAGVIANASETERIVIPTAANEVPRTTVRESDEELTVVSGARRADSAELPPPPVVAAAPPPAAHSSNFSPGRIALYSIAALLVVFAVVFAFQSRGTSEGETASPQLTPDPNSQPVQAINPPTGEAETNLPQVAPTASTGQPGSGGSGVGAPPPTDANANVELQPTPSEGGGASPNANQRPDAERQPTPEASPTPRRRIPNPNVNVSVDPVPPPMPRRETPQATPPPVQLSEPPPSASTPNASTPRV